MPINLDQNNIREHLSRIYKAPILAVPEQEQLLLQLVNSKSDDKRKEIRTLLLKANLRRVVEIAKEFLNSGPDFPKLVEVGNRGLAEAIFLYNPGTKVSSANFINWIDSGIRMRIFEDCLKMNEACWNYFFEAHKAPNLSAKQIQSLCSKIARERDKTKKNDLKEQLVKVLMRLVFDIASTFLFQASNFFDVITAGDKALRIAVLAIAANKVRGHFLPWIFMHIHFGIYEAFGVDDPEKALYDGELPSEATNLEADNLSEYIVYIRESIKLSTGEQQKLSEQLRKETTPRGIRSISDQLTEANLVVVVHMAKELIGRGATFIELIKAGNRGLVKAVFNYDPSTWDTNFCTYAMWEIRYAMCSSCLGITNPEQMYDERFLPPLIDDTD